MRTTRLPLAITCGDPAGIGPEVIARWLGDEPADAAGVTVLGPAEWLERLPAAGRKIVIGREDYRAVPGRPDPEGALVALAAMERAAKGCSQGEFGGVVTGPVSKAALAAIGYPHPGQTEFFAARWGGEPVMGFCGEKLRVVLATWHVPLVEVPQLLGPQRLQRTIAAAAELARALAPAPGDQRWQPRIGVCGLNPHAGEGGMLGGEEQDFLNPWLERERQAWPGLSGCEPADSLFVRHLRGEFDVVVALYHDQGLGPLKTLEFDTAVNVTLGLPFVRTSPDHGTAFGLAGKNGASAGSFAHAVAVARRLIQARAQA